MIKAVGPLAEQSVDLVGLVTEYTLLETAWHKLADSYEQAVCKPKPFARSKLFFNALALSGQDCSLVFTPGHADHADPAGYATAQSMWVGQSVSTPAQLTSVLSKSGVDESSGAKAFDVESLWADALVFDSNPAAYPYPHLVEEDQVGAGIFLIKQFDYATKVPSALYHALKNYQSQLSDQCVECSALLQPTACPTTGTKGLFGFKSITLVHHHNMTTERLVLMPFASNCSNPQNKQIRCYAKTDIGFELLEPQDIIQLSK